MTRSPLAFLFALLVLSCVCCAVPARATITDLLANGQFIGSVGYNHADILEESWDGYGGYESDDVGNSAGYTLEGALYLPLGESFALEGGFMRWKIDEFSKSGPTASAIFRLGALRLGLGVAPDLFRFFARAHFGQPDVSGHETGLFGQLAISSYLEDQDLEYGETSLDSFLTLSLGCAF